MSQERMLVVYAYAKILILKQITTKLTVISLSLSCICLCKDTNFKANHNQTAIKFDQAKGCICLCKDTNFKANHNLTVERVNEQIVVYAYAKILILKQITTYRCYA